MNADQILPDKKAGLEINPMPDGYVVYDASVDKVHYLNQTSAVVFELCGSGRSIQTAAQFLQGVYELPTLPLAEVESAVKGLQTAELTSQSNPK